MPKRRRTRAKFPRQEASVVAPTLPNEILDSIVSFVASDRRHFKVLSSLSLTSKNWFSIARPYIFRSVWLHCIFRVYQLAQLLDQYPAMYRWIREIHIRHPYPVFDFWEVFTAKSPLKLERLENLHALYFETPRTYRPGLWILSGNWETVLQFTQGLRKLTTVRELHILNSLVDIPLLSCLLGCLPSLHSISMLGKIEEDFYERLAILSFSHEQLTHVHLDSITLCHLMFPLLHGVRELRLTFGSHAYNRHSDQRKSAFLCQAHLELT